MSVDDLIPDVFLKFTYNGITLKYQEVEGIAQCYVIYDDSYKQLTRVEIPNSALFDNPHGLLTVIGVADGCFEGCADLTTVIFPQYFFEIGKSSFKGCSSLQYISLPFSISRNDNNNIGDNCFDGCSSLQHIALPVGTKIGKECFKNCCNLESISFNREFTLDENCFTNCEKLTSFVFPFYSDDFLYPNKYDSNSTLDKSALDKVIKLYKNLPLNQQKIIYFNFESPLDMLLSMQSVFEYNSIDLTEDTKNDIKNLTNVLLNINFYRSKFYTNLPDNPTYVKDIYGNNTLSFSTFIINEPNQNDINFSFKIVFYDNNYKILSTQDLSFERIISVVQNTFYSFDIFFVFTNTSTKETLETLCATTKYQDLTLTQTIGRTIGRQLLPYILLYTTYKIIKNKETIHKYLNNGADLFLRLKNEYEPKVKEFWKNNIS